MERTEEHLKIELKVIHIPLLGEFPANTFLRNTYGLLTKREVKVAGHWPRSCFCVFMDLDSLSVHKNAKKRGQNPTVLTEQSLVNKGFYYMENEHYFIAAKIAPSHPLW